MRHLAAVSAAYLLTACSSEAPEASLGKADYLDISVAGDLDSGNVVRSMLSALDRGDMNLAKQLTKSLELAPPLTQSNFRLETLASSPRCTAWEIAAVENRVKLLRGCPCGAVRRYDSYYLTVKNAEIASIRRDPANDVEC